MMNARPHTKIFTMLIFMAIAFTATAITPLPTDMLIIPSDGMGYGMGDLGVYGRPTSDALAKNPANLRWTFRGFTPQREFLHKSQCIDTLRYRSIAKGSRLLTISANRWVFDNALFQIGWAGTAGRHIGYGLSLRYLQGAEFDNQVTGDPFPSSPDDFYWDGDEAIRNSAFAASGYFALVPGRKGLNTLGIGVNYLGQNLGDEDPIGTLSLDFGYLLSGSIFSLGISANDMSIRLSGAGEDDLDQFVPTRYRADLWMQPQRVVGPYDANHLSLALGAGVSSRKWDNPTANFGVDLAWSDPDENELVSLYWGMPNVSDFHQYNTAYPQLMRLGLGVNLFALLGGTVLADIAYDGEGGKRPDRQDFSGIASISWLKEAKADTMTTYTIVRRMDKPCTGNCPDCPDGQRVIIAKQILSMEDFYEAMGLRPDDSSIRKYLADNNPHISHWTCLDSGQVICVPADYKPKDDRVKILPNEIVDIDVSDCLLPDCIVYVVKNDCECMEDFRGKRDPERIKDMNPEIVNWTCLPEEQMVRLYPDSCSMPSKIEKHTMGYSIRRLTGPELPVPSPQMEIIMKTPCLDRDITILAKDTKSGKIIDSMTVRPPSEKVKVKFKNLGANSIPSDSLTFVVKDDGIPSDSFLVEMPGLHSLSRVYQGDNDFIYDLKGDNRHQDAVILVQDRSQSTERDLGGKQAFAVMDSALLSIIDEIRYSPDFKEGDLYLGLYEFGQATGYDASRVSDVCDKGVSYFCTDYRNVVPLDDAYNNIAAIWDEIYADLTYKKDRGCSPILALLDDILIEKPWETLPEGTRTSLVIVSDGYEWCYAQPWGRLRVKPRARLDAWADTTRMEFQRILDELHQQRIEVFVLSSGVKERFAPFIFKTFEEENPLRYVEGQDSLVNRQSGFIRRILGGSIIFDEEDVDVAVVTVSVDSYYLTKDSMELTIQLSNFSGGHLVADRISYSLQSPEGNASHLRMESRDDIMRRIGLIHAFPWKDVRWNDSISGGEGLVGYTFQIFVEATYAGQKISISSDPVVIERVLSE